MASGLLRPLSIGEILDGVFRLYQRHFIALVGTALGLILPALLLTFVSDLLMNLAVSMLGVIATAVSVWLASEAILGRTPVPREGVKVAVRRTLPLVGYGFLYFIVITFAVLALIVPAVLLWIMWFAWVPIVVLERVFPFGRSRALARGEWTKIFFVSLVGVIIVLLPQFVLIVGTVAVFGIGAATGQVATPLLVLVAQVLLSALTLPFTASLQTLLYYEQRVRKEGFDVAHTAASLGVTDAVASA